MRREPYPKTKAALLAAMALSTVAVARSAQSEWQRYNAIRAEAARPTVAQERLARDIKDYPQIRDGKMVVLSLKNIPKAEARLAETR